MRCATRSYCFLFIPYSHSHTLSLSLSFSLLSSLSLSLYFLLLCYPVAAIADGGDIANTEVERVKRAAAAAAKEQITDYRRKHKADSKLGCSGYCP